MVQSGSKAVPAGEVAALKTRTDALRQAVLLPGADPAALLQAVFTELDAAIDGLVAAGTQASEGRKGDASAAVHA
ncbi:MAG: hypothetical protein ACRDNF_24965, partial [Streptosporangiaceae bacterium]